MCTKEWPTNKEIPGTRDVSRNVDVTMPARTSIPALTGKSLYRDGLHEKGFKCDKPCTISCSVLLSP